MTFDTPGVSIVYNTDGPLVIRAASTSTAVFIGPTVVGRSVVDPGSGPEVTPTFVSSLSEYGDVFSTPGARAGVVCLPTENNAITDSMGHAVRGFFMNGGQNAYIVSTSGTQEATASIHLSVADGGGNAFYRVDARSPGAWGNDINIAVADSAIAGDFVDVTVTLALTGVTASETFTGVAAGAVHEVNSNLVDITALGADPGGSPVTIGNDDDLAGGENSSASETAQMALIFEALRDIQDISIIVFPDRVWPTHQADFSLALAHCQRMKDRVTLIQLADSETDFASASVPLDKFASVYYPQARVTLPTAGGGSSTATVNTTGHIAGIIARTDAEKGVWTAPAGVHSSIAGITELTVDIGDSFQARMNPHNINALRAIQGIPVIWGARTRDQGGIYEYLPVMRTAILIADSLRDTLQRSVFAKNTEDLWANITAGVNGFMDGLYAQGAFQGATPGQAFRVAVGLNKSMSQADIRAGICRVNVAFAPALVAEFIEISIEQIFEPG